MNLISKYRKTSLLAKLLGAMIIGAVIGAIFGEKILFLEPFGKIFLQLLKMAALPLILFNLIAGISSLSDPKILGRVGGKIMIYYVATTAMALVVSLFVAGIIQPGIGFQLTEPFKGEIAEVPSILTTLVNMIPSNIFSSLAKGSFDQVIVFSTFVGIAVIMMEKSDREYLSGFFGATSRMFCRLVGIVMGYAPIGVGVLIAVTVGKYGKALAGFLVKFMASMYISIAVMIAVYLIFIVVCTRKNPFAVLKKCMPGMLTAFCTTSSMATVPVNMECADDLGISKTISGFTIPLGAQVNKDGQGILIALTFMVASQCVGIDMSLNMMIKMIVMGLILTTGTGGMPGGSIVSLAIIVETFGLPMEVVGVIAGVFTLVDMGSTMMNCLGDLVGTVIVADSEDKRLEKSAVGKERIQA